MGFLLTLILFTEAHVMKLPEELARDLMDLVSKGEASLKELSPEELEKKPSPEKWSKKEMLGHLIDSALNNIQRFVNVQFLDHPNIVYNQNEWVKRNNHQANDVKELLRFWVFLNRHAAFIIKNTDKHLLERGCNLGKEGEEIIKPLHWIIQDYIHHMEYHLGQIVSRIKEEMPLTNPYKK